MKAIVIMNENHAMLEDQERIMQENYDFYEILAVPASGWTLEEMQNQAKKLDRKCYNEGFDIVFISPVPVLLCEMSRRSQGADTHDTYSRYNVRVFHNDNREKKELPNGKIISVVAKDGWQLV